MTSTTATAVAVKTEAATAAATTTTTTTTTTYYIYKTSFKKATSVLSRIDEDLSGTSQPQQGYCLFH